MTILLVLCLCLLSNIYRANARLATEDLDERYLKLINKPPIQSIHTKFGHIIDCVDINKQPAFDHPLLQNHKLQRRPRFFKQKGAMAKEHGLHTRSFEFELEKDPCPIGSVPIRRTTEDDLIRMRTLSNDTHFLTLNSPDSHIATLFTKKGNNSYFGVHGHINVQNPRVKKTQMSLAQIAVQNGEQDGVNSIVLGWQVAPELYGRKSTNVFALWTSDSFKTGCYNMLCPGFIQIDRSIILGSPIGPISFYEGEQYNISMSISQDLKSKNWWLIINDVNVGYYPATLFTNMSEADIVGWGGKVDGVVKGTSPQMGSGYFPDGDLTHACYIKKLTYNINGSFEDLHEDRLNSYVDNQHCYQLKYLGFLNDDDRYTFQFGGPGGDCTRRSDAHLGNVTS